MCFFVIYLFASYVGFIVGYSLVFIYFLFTVGYSLIFVSFSLLVMYC